MALHLAALLATPAVALAGPRHLPPDVDFDPEHGMPFGRMSKMSLDRRVFDTMKKALSSKVMDPAIEPYNSVVRPSRYEPSTGRIHDSLTYTLRDMKHNEDVSRKFRGDTKDLKNQQNKPVVTGLFHPQRLMKSPVVDPVLALQKAAKKTDDDDDD